MYNPLLKRAALRRFTEQDWSAFGGTNEFTDGSGPYIADVKIVRWVATPEGADPEMGIVTVGGDLDSGEPGASFVSIFIGEQNCFDFFDSKEKALAEANRIIAHGLDYEDLRSRGYEMGIDEEDVKEGLMNLSDEYLLERAKKKHPKSSLLRRAASNVMTFKIEAESSDADGLIVFIIHGNTSIEVEAGLALTQVMSPREANEWEFLYTFEEAFVFYNERLWRKDHQGEDEDGENIDPKYLLTLEPVELTELSEEDLLVRHEFILHNKQ